MIWTWNFGTTMSRHVVSCISCMPHPQNGTFVERTVCVGDRRDGRVLQKLTARCVDGLLQRQTKDWATGTHSEAHDVDDEQFSSGVGSFELVQQFERYCLWHRHVLSVGNLAGLVGEMAAFAW